MPSEFAATTVIYQVKSWVPFHIPTAAGFFLLSENYSVAI